MFKSHEFQCKCGCNQAHIGTEFLAMLYDARQRAKIPFILTSAYRCQDHNDKIGGSPGSSHLLGCAVDIACDGSASRMRIVHALLDAGFTRIGIAGTFIHVDSDPGKPTNVMWTY